MICLMSLVAVMFVVTFLGFMRDRQKVMVVFNALALLFKFDLELMNTKSEEYFQL